MVAIVIKESLLSHMKSIIKQINQTGLAESKEITEEVHDFIELHNQVKLTHHDHITWEQYDEIIIICQQLKKQHAAPSGQNDNKHSRIFL